MKAPQLVNVEEKAKHGSFLIPPLERRTKLPVNGRARLIYQGSDGLMERVWVRVKLAVAEGDKLRYHGTLEADTKTLPFRADDRVVFGPEHVLEILHPLVDG